MSIVVVTGPPGAGKSTIAAALARSKPRGVHLPTDHWYHWIVTGYVPPWRPEAATQNPTVIEAIASSAAHYSAGGYHVTVDGIVGPWFLDRFLGAAGHRRGRIDYVVLRPARAVARRRAVERTGDEDLTDPGPVDAMYDAFEGLGPFEAHVVDSSHQDPTATLGAVAAGLDAGTFTLAQGPARDPERWAGSAEAGRTARSSDGKGVVHLVYGYLGVGKTTFARSLAEATGAVLLSEDEWYLRLYGDGSATHYLDPVLWRRVVGLLGDLWPRIAQGGQDVVLDFGFWKRSQRDTARQVARHIGAPTRLWWVQAEEETARGRVARRNEQPGSSFFLPGDSYDALRAGFEPLGDDEPFELVDTTER